MTNYTDISSNFKLVQAADAAGLSLRNARILAMFLNQLGLDNHFHELVLAVMSSQNWDLVDGMVEIPFKKLARKLSADDDVTFKRVYERLKKNKPEFIKWQDQQSFTIIQIQNIPYNPESKRSRTLYGCPLYDIIRKLFCLPETLSEKKIRLAVWEQTIKIMGKSEPKPRKRKKTRRLETTARRVRRIGNELVQDAGSVEIAAVYLWEADSIPEEGVTIKELAEALLKIKDL